MVFAFSKTIQYRFLGVSGSDIGLTYFHVKKLWESHNQLQLLEFKWDIGKRYWVSLISILEYLDIVQIHQPQTYAYSWTIWMLTWKAHQFHTATKDLI